jgi:D-serine deaminase-like pyridoxal phosphate-dependent protein
LSRAIEVRHRARKAGFNVPVFSVGGTGTYNVDCDIEGVTDVQVGSYLFMDVNYRNVGGKSGAIFDDFKPSLLVLATAISQPVKGRITIDAGIKAFATDKEPPQLLDVEGVTYSFGGDEHGYLHLKNPSRDIKIGDKVLLIASHCDPTVNLYDHYYPFRGETVEEMWPVAARGKSQ